MPITTTRMKPDGTLGYYDGERELTLQEIAQNLTPGTTAAVEFQAKYGIPVGGSKSPGTPAPQQPVAQTSTGSGQAPAQQQAQGPGGPDQATIDQLMAVYKANPTLQTKVSEGDGGATYAQAQGTTVNGYTIALDPNTGQPFIFKPIKQGGMKQEVTAVYDTNGKFQGNSSGDSTSLGLAKFVAGAFGMYGAGVGLDGMINGAATGATSGGGFAAQGMTTAEQAAFLEANAGALAPGGEIAAGYGSSWGVGADGIIGQGATMAADGSMLSPDIADPTNTNYSNEGRNYPNSQSTQGPGGSPVNSSMGSPTPSINPANPSRTAIDGISKVPAGGWQTLGQLAGTALTLGGAAAAGGAVSGSGASTSKFDQLFANLLTEQQKVSGRGDSQWADYLSTFRPVEQQMARSAMEYNQPWRREQAATEAMNTVANQFDQQRQASAEDMARMGVDGSAIAMLGDSSRIIEAKARAGAANNARAQVEQTGLNLVRDAAQFGRQLPGTAMQASGVVTGTTSAASNIATNQAQIQNQNTQNKNAMIGDLIGAGLQAWGMFGSSKKTKKVGKRVSGLAAIKAVEGSPAKDWRYKDGEGDGNTKQRMGPMAEDLEREAPGVSDGEQVDAISMLGLHHAAIAGLAQEVRGLKRLSAGRA